MRNVKWIFVVLIASSLTSFADKSTTTGGLNVGDVAPDFNIEPTSVKSNNAEFSLAKMKGKPVLLSFWASYDAASRMQNIKLHSALQNLGSEVQMVSISFDEFPSIFKETVRMDQINLSNCYLVVDGDESNLFKTYKLNQGFKNFLLDENGVIIAKNVTTSEIPSLLLKSAS